MLGTIKPPDWILSTIKYGIRIPFKSEPPTMVFPKNKTANLMKNKQWIRQTLNEYIEYDFVKKVFSPPKLILPLQVSEHSSGKKCLIHDEGPLNDYVHEQKFKLENWEEMFNYSLNANSENGIDLCATSEILQIIIFTFWLLY